MFYLFVNTAYNIKVHLGGMVLQYFGKIAPLTYAVISDRQK